VWCRLHDIGWPGWTLILMFVRFVNVLALLLLVMVPGQKKATRTARPQFFSNACGRSEVAKCPIKTEIIGEVPTVSTFPVTLLGSSRALDRVLWHLAVCIILAA